MALPVLSTYFCTEQIGQAFSNAKKQTYENKRKIKKLKLHRTFNFFGNNLQYTLKVLRQMTFSL